MSRFSSYTFISCCLGLTILAGCNFPRPTQTVEPDAIATQVSSLLTTTPTSTYPTSVFPQSIPTTTPLILATATSPVAVIASTQPAYPTPPPANFDPIQVFGPPTATDPMDKSNFFLPTNDPTHYQADFSNGVLQMTSFTPDGWHSWLLSYIRLSDFYLEGKFTNATCAGMDRAGWLVRSPDPTQGYLFGISCDGQFSFRKWDGSGFTDLLDWKTSDAVLTGANQTNRLGVLARGDHFSLYVNGSLVGETQDQSFSQGVFGIFQAASETADYTVSIDDVSYWILSQ
ncbi:MAG TPA: hypothetical protein VHO48_02080 [Anaerolineaceae bacterium]|jgi:hypothetical protein|nr:hypothetical protein [Anaerolineaceae bacterium]